MNPTTAPSRALSAEERGLIDAAIAAGMVRRIPTGVSGLPDPLAGQHWRDAQAQFFANLRRGERIRNGGQPTQRQARAVSKMRTAQRRERLDATVRNMMAEGLTYRQMAERLGMAVGAIHARCQRIRNNVGAADKGVAA